MSRLVIFALVCLVLGVVLLTLLELTIPGVVLLFAFIVAGVFAIADPAFLSED
jgi:hypothetical protein